MRRIAASSCGPQSQRAEWKTSPVRQRRVHAHQHVVAVADVSLDQRHVGFAIDQALVGDDAEVAMIGRQRRRRDAAHQRLRPHPVLDQIGDGDHQQLVPLGESRQLRAPAPCVPSFDHDFADDAGRIQPGDAREIDGRLGLPGAHQHAAVAGLRAETCGPAARDRTDASADRWPPARSRRDRGPRCRCSSPLSPRSTR